VANRFWVGGTGNWSDTAHWSTLTGGSGGAAVPTSSDAVVFDANSGSSGTTTINVAASASTLTMGSGWGDNLNTMIFNAGLTVAGAFIWNGGTLNTNGQTWSCFNFSSSGVANRSLTLGASSITCTGRDGTTFISWQYNGTNATLNAGTSTITCSSATAGPAFSGLATHTYNAVNMTGPGTTQVIGANLVCAAFTYTGLAATNCIFGLQVNLTVSGLLTITGNSVINRPLVNNSSADGTARTVSAGSVSITNADFQDITAAGAATPFTGTSLGNCQGNSNITFDTPATQTHTASAGGNWSDVTKWTSRIPLPQDDVVIDSNTTGTITANMPRMGKSIDFTGFTGTAALNSVANDVFGSLTLSTGMTFTHNQAMNFRGRSSYTITSAGKTFGNSVNFRAPSGTYTLQDAFVNSGSLNWFNGNFTTGSNNMTAFSFSANTVQSAKTFTFGSSTLTATGTGNIWDWFVTSNTIAANTATVVFTDTTSTAKTMRGAGASYNGMSFTINGSATNVFNWGNVNGTGTGIGTLTIQAPNNVTFFSGITTGLTSLVATGSAGNIITIKSSTAGSASTISKTSGTVSADYLSLKDSKAQGGAAWYAGTNSTNVSGNTGWIFTDPPKANFLAFF
jgi:hypothetical protein